MRAMRLANRGLFTGFHVRSNRFQFCRRERFSPEGKKRLIFLIEVRQKQLHQVVEAAAPIGIDAVFPEPDGEAFHRKHDRRMVIAQLVDQAAIGDALVVVQDAAVAVFFLEMRLERFLESVQFPGQGLGALLHGRAERLRLFAQGLVIGR